MSEVFKHEQDQGNLSTFFTEKTHNTSLEEALDSNSIAFEAYLGNLKSQINEIVDVGFINQHVGYLEKVIEIKGPQKTDKEWEKKGKKAIKLNVNKIIKLLNHRKMKLNEKTRETDKSVVSADTEAKVLPTKEEGEDVETGETTEEPEVEDEAEPAEEENYIHSFDGEDESAVDSEAVGEQVFNNFDEALKHAQKSKKGVVVEPSAEHPIEAIRDKVLAEKKAAEEKAEETVENKEEKTEQDEDTTDSQQKEVAEAVDKNEDNELVIKETKQEEKEKPVEKKEEEKQEEKPAEKKKENKTKEQEISIENLADIKTFITDAFPKMDKNFSIEKGKGILEKTINVFVHESHTAKAKGETAIQELLKTTDEFEGILLAVETSDIKETSKSNLAQDIIKELHKLKKALNEKLDELSPAKEETKKEKKVVVLNSIKGISLFVKKELSEISDIELTKKDKEISGAFTSEFEGLGEDDVPNALILKGETLKLKRALEAVAYDGEKGIFINKMKNVVNAFLEAIDRKTNTIAKESTTSEKKDTEPKATEPDPEPDPEPEKPDNSKKIEDMIDHGDIDSPTEIPATIKKDVKFNTWLETLFNRGYEGGAKTIEDWHTLYAEQKVKTDKIKEIFKDSEIEKGLFEGFETQKEKDSARKIYFEKMESEYVTDPATLEKIEFIIAKHEAIKIQTEKIKILEADKRKMEAAYNGKTILLSEEAVFKAHYGKNAEMKKLTDMEGFLSDMEHNYSHYYGSNINKNVEIELSEMFDLYRRSHTDPSEYKTEKMGKFKRFFSRAKHALSVGRYKEADYDDKKTFKDKIKALRSGGVLATETVHEDTAQDNMARLKGFTAMVRQGVEGGQTIQEALAEIGGNEPVAKELFLKVFPKYVSSIANNARMQSQAKNAETRREVFDSIDREIEKERDIMNQDRGDLVDRSVGEDSEREEFETLVKQELTAEKLQILAEKLGGKTLDAKTLESLSFTFAEINEDDADGLTYKNVALQLAQAEIKHIANAKDVNFAPQSMKKYNRIFENGSMPVKEKIEAVDALLNLCKTKVATLKKPGQTIERLELQKFIKYFENIKSSLR